MGIYWPTFFFYLFSAIAVAFAIAVVVSPNIVRMALYLVMSLAGTAGLLVVFRFVRFYSCGDLLRRNACAVGIWCDAHVAGSFHFDADEQVLDSDGGRNWLGPVFHFGLGCMERACMAPIGSGGGRGSAV